MTIYNTGRQFNTIILNMQNKFENFKPLNEREEEFQKELEKGEEVNEEKKENRGQFYLLY